MAAASHVVFGTTRVYRKNPDACENDCVHQSPLARLLDTPVPGDFKSFQKVLKNRASEHVVPQANSEPRKYIATAICYSWETYEHRSVRYFNKPPKQKKLLRDYMAEIMRNKNIRTCYAEHVVSLSVPYLSGGIFDAVVAITAATLGAAGVAAADTTIPDDIPDDQVDVLDVRSSVGQSLHELYANLEYQEAIVGVEEIKPAPPAPMPAPSGTVFSRWLETARRHRRQRDNSRSIEEDEGEDEDEDKDEDEDEDVLRLQLLQSDGLILDSHHGGVTESLSAHSRLQSVSNWGGEPLWNQAPAGYALPSPDS